MDNGDKRQNLPNARTITLTGNATGSTSFDGSGNVSISVTVGYASAAGSAGYATKCGNLWRVFRKRRQLQARQQNLPMLGQ